MASRITRSLVYRDFGSLEGFDLNVALYPDKEHPAPTEESGFFPQEIKDWENGFWQFVILEFTSSVDAVPISSESVKGAVYGNFRGSSVDPVKAALRGDHANALVRLTDKSRARSVELLKELAKVI